MLEKQSSKANLLQALLPPYRLLLGASTAFFILAIIWINAQAFAVPPSDKSCIYATSAWSPALDVVEYAWETFTEPAKWHPHSELVGQSLPSSDVERAWHDILPEGVITIPETRLQDLKLPTDLDWIRVKVDRNTNHTELLAIPEVFVQLSCVDFLRKQTLYVDYPNYYGLWHGGPAAQHGQDLTLRRVDRCLERLRRALMCWGDVTPILWKAHDTRPGADLATLHSCRNFDDILDWTNENSIRIEQGEHGYWKV